MSTQEDPSTEGEPDLIKTLRDRGDKAEARAKEMEAKIAEFERSSAFSEAGVPVDGAAAYFRKAYEGEITPEAIKAEWDKLGVGAPAGDPEPQGQPIEPSQDQLLATQLAGQSLSSAQPSAVVDEGQEILTKMASLEPHELPGYLREIGVVHDNESGGPQLQDLPPTLKPPGV